jgi:D-isomer specific 2-hydroxyacid dehydrogenase, catalytic domain
MSPPARSALRLVINVYQHNIGQSRGHVDEVPKADSSPRTSPANAILRSVSLAEIPGGAICSQNQSRPFWSASIPDAEVVVPQPLRSAYLTTERFAKAKELKLTLIARIGSDHVNPQAAIDSGITVARLAYRNSISVAEHIVKGGAFAPAQSHSYRQT